MIDLTKNEENISMHVNIHDLIKEIMVQKPWFNGFVQNDSHEFLMYFFDILCPNNNNKDYFGQTKTGIKCLECGTVSETIEDFNTINLNVPIIDDPKKVLGLVHMFINYLKTEQQTDPNNLYFCDKCSKHTESEKSVCLWKLPTNLIIVLKRYSESRKINTQVGFPLENMKIIETCSNDLHEYSLTGVVNHYGIQYGGHYTSCVNIHDEWYSIDDESISKIKPEKLYNNGVYMLFYSTGKGLPR